MSRTRGWSWLAAAWFAALTSAAGAGETVPFDAGWRFFKGDCPGAETPSFDDRAWRALNVPHDWSIEGPFDQGHPAGGAGGFLPTGVGWYRKTFSLPAAAAGRHVFVEFDGVMANSDVWINGTHLGRRPYGYVGFRYDLTGRVRFGGDKGNVLVVRADNSRQLASRWYAGAGIYRHVRLVMTEGVHLDAGGTFVSTPSVERQAAAIRVENTVVNETAAPREITVAVTILGPDGKTVAAGQSLPQILAAAGRASVRQEFTVTPQLWDLDRPHLYRAVCRVRAGSETPDAETTTFGIRRAEFRANTGFWLNGRNLKIKGVCLHQDVGGLGTAVPAAAWGHRLRTLKALGCNAIRTAHHPFAPEFYDLCDRLGLLVMDELFDCWTAGKNPYDYHLDFKEWSVKDTRDVVRRDRNHPCVILYSAGNEIRDTKRSDAAKATLASLLEAFHREDPTRPVTQALFRPNTSHDYDNGLADMLDVVGTNYRDGELLAAHKAKPTRKILGTENAKDLKAWRAVRDSAPYAGQFLWTGADYLGESRRWPTVGYEGGLLDLVDQVRAIGYQRMGWWSETPMVHMARAGRDVATGNQAGEPQVRPTRFSDWTPANRDDHEEVVEVYSNCRQVELVLNGVSLGSQTRPADDSPRVWKVPFKPGTLRAVASNDGQTVATHELRTAGKAVRVVLTAHRDRLTPAWDDLVIVRAAVVDENGVLQPQASDEITFGVSGPGRIAALQSGNLDSHEPFQSDRRHVFYGVCTAYLQALAAGGPITLTGSAPGLAPGSVTVETVAIPTK